MLFLCVLAGFVFAQSTEEKMILTVKIKGNLAISTQIILSKIRTSPGKVVSQEMINDDIKRLYAMGYFTDVAIDVEDYEKGVAVTIIVEEKPVVSEITFEGNKRLRASQLKKVMQTKEGDMLKFSSLSQDMNELKSFYERNGFNQVEVKYELDKNEDNQVIIKVFVDEKERIKIKKISVEGNEAVAKKIILGMMSTQTAWLFRKGYFDNEMFEQDLIKIKMHYQNLGYLDTSITPAFDYEEIKGLMYITLKINEGKQYHVGEIKIGGNIILPKEEVEERVAMKAGDPFSYNKLRGDVESIRGLYYHKGYMNAEIGADRTLDPVNQKINIDFAIDAKEIVYIGKVNIKGNTKTKDVILRRELRIYPGEKFDGDKIKRSKERLYNLGFFEDIYFETIPTDKLNINDLEINVKETKTGEFSFGGGYSSVDEFIGFVQVVQKNFDLLNFPYFTGDGQNLVIKGEIGMVRNDYEISWTEPWIFDYPLAFGFDAYHRTHLRTTNVGYGYKEVRSGGDVRFGKEFWEYFRSDLLYRMENVDISDVADDASQDEKDEEGSNWLSSIIFGVQFDNRDNVFSPTKGVVSTLSVENTGGFLFGDKNFVKGFFSASFYYSPIQKIVIEFKGRAGMGDSYGNTDKIPIYERFYAGGATTIRGYKERRVGPRDPSSNDPVGGEALLVGNIELTFPIYEKVIKGAVFYDIGNVWGSIEDFAVGGNYKQGAGIGIRVKTPIGPLKLDWGYPLNDNHDDKREGELYFSMSHGF